LTEPLSPAFHAEKKVMKTKPAGQLALYHQLMKSQNLAEVQMSYRSKVKPSDRQKITSSKDSYDLLKDV
jgi:hypothetical protein